MDFVVRCDLSCDSMSHASRRLFTARQSEVILRDDLAKVLYNWVMSWGH